MQQILSFKKPQVTVFYPTYIYCKQRYALKSYDQVG